MTAGLDTCARAAVDSNIGLEIVSVAGGGPREVAHSEWLRGFCWLPEGSGFVFSSSSGSSLLYPPVFNLRTIGLDGTGGRQLTFGDQSFVEPDVHRSGKLLACGSGASRISGDFR